ncbi:MAG: hypothetical protein KF836_06335 [Fimbriimonadaceae bacterium]|nr:hypothetical protein [Fimbriimonadaceae bacterium]
MKNTILSLILLATATFGLVVPAKAHEADCPYCKTKLVQNTKDQDNEVVVKYGNKKIEYRCVYCVFADQKKFSSDLVVYAPSESVGKPIILKRTDGKWSAPDGTLFLNTFKRHKDCAEQSRAFTSKQAFDKYVAANNIANAKALTLEEMLKEVAKK